MSLRKTELSDADRLKALIGNSDSDEDVPEVERLTQLTKQPKPPKEPKEPKEKAPRLRKTEPKPKAPPKNTTPSVVAAFETAKAAQDINIDDVLQQMNSSAQAPDDLSGMAKYLEASDSDDDAPVGEYNLERLLFGGKAEATTPAIPDPVADEPQVPSEEPEMKPPAPELPPPASVSPAKPPVVSVKSEVSHRGFAAPVPSVVETEIDTTALTQVKTEVASPSVPSATVSDDDVTFYWLDARELSHAHPVDAGSVTLYGKCRDKQGGWHSCCVRVRGMQRCVMALVPDGADEGQCVAELTALARTRGISSRVVKPVKRMYAFEDKDIPREQSQWLKMSYAASFPPLFDVSQGPPKTQHVGKLFGVHRSLLELLLIKRRFEGPSFVELKGAQRVSEAQQLSHCAFEFVVQTPKHVTPRQAADLAPPPLIAMSVHVHAQLDDGGRANEIFAIATATTVINADASSQALPKVDATVAFRPPSKTSVPMDLTQHCQKHGISAVRTFGSETGLLQWFVEQLGKVDPDLLVGHNFLSFSLDVLLHRFASTKASTLWSKLGRAKLSTMPKLQTGAGGTRDSTFQEREVCVGRLVVDTYLLSREHYKTTSYKLLHLAHSLRIPGLFGIVTAQQADEPPPLLPSGPLSNGPVFSLLSRCLNNTVLCLGLSNRLDFVPLTKRLTTVAGNLWSRTLSGSRAERIEYLLLHEFHRAKFVTPDKRSYAQMKRAREDENEEQDSGPKYKGGKVLDPKTGLYKEYILLLDFNSLYPSIIQEFDVCFTTVNRELGPEGPVVPSRETIVCDTCLKSGVEQGPCPHRCLLPRVIARLVNGRRSVKRMMKQERDSSKYAQLDTRQKALKLTANSMYGCLGFEYSRFYAQPLAELVTQQGRAALEKAVEIVSSGQLEVIYGDTDSVMIRTGNSTDLAAVRAAAEKIKADVNKTYRHLEIDIDGVFKSMLLHKKKKYAAVTVVDFMGAGKETKLEVKGLDMVRRDWCPLAKKACQTVLDLVLTPQGTTHEAVESLVNSLGQIATDARTGNVFPLNEFIISKSITREPSAYKDMKQPHVQVALRMKQRNEQVRVGDLIPYVVCKSDTDDKKLCDRAFHVDEVRQSTEKALDVEWYLLNQVLPPVLRMCEHIQGFTTKQLTDAMGVVHHEPAPVVVHDNEEEGATPFVSSVFSNEKFESGFPLAERLMLRCMCCGNDTAVDPHESVAAINESHRAKETPLASNIYQCVPCFKQGRRRSGLGAGRVLNALMSDVHRRIGDFYARGATEQDAAQLWQQISYYRALFDVPLRCTDKELVEAHLHVLRLVDPDTGKGASLAHVSASECENAPLEFINDIYQAFPGATLSTKALFPTPQ